MKLPRLQRYVKAGPSHLISVPLEAFARQRICKRPSTSAHIPRDLDSRLRRGSAEIHDNQTPVISVTPSPRQDVSKACIVRPPGTLAETPLALMKNRITDCPQQLPVKRTEFLIRRLVGTTPQKNRHSDTPPFHLAFMKQPRPREGRDRNCDGALLLRRKHGRRTRLVVVLNESHELFLKLQG